MRIGISRVFILALASAMLLCCNQRSSETMSALQHADEIIEDLPDSAYAILKGFDTQALRTTEEQAYYSLLLSMAIDKQYIDLTTDSIIAPAVEYYKHHGSHRDKMRTAYYHARIFENRKDDETAMEILIRNQKHMEKTDDHEFRGRYYEKKAAMYDRNYNFTEALDISYLTNEEYRLSGKINRYVSGLFSTSTYCQQLGKYEESKDLLDEIRLYWNSISDYRKGEYFREYINIHLLHYHDSGALLRDECLSSNISPKNIPYLTIADSFIAENDGEHALEYIELFIAEHSDWSEKTEYLLRLEAVQELLGLYEEALSTEKLLRRTDDIKDLVIIQSDTRFLEERVRKQEQSRNNALTIAILVVAVFSLVLFSLLACRYMKKKWKRMRELQTSLLEEKNSLQGIINHSTFIDKEDIAIIENRLSILSNIALKKNTGQNLFSISERKLSEIQADRNEILLSLAALFSCSHPELIKALRDKGLTNKERGYCCLYILGLSTKEINNTLFLGTGYKHNNIIRKKLGITSTNINLATYLKELDASARQIDESATKG